MLFSSNQKRMRWEGHDARIAALTNALEILVRKPKLKGPLEKI
jgi:hypothetical protein